MTGPRLYVASHGIKLKWCLAETLKHATVQLGQPARIPDADDLRIFWNKSNIANMTPEERKKAFNVSRQTMSTWRRKGGGDLKTLRDAKADKRRHRVQMYLKSDPDASIYKIAAVTGFSYRTIQNALKALGVQPRKGQQKRIPPDAELLALAEGKTWREIADTLGVSLTSLRMHVYANKSLAEEIRRVRRHVPNNQPAINPQHLKKIKAMGKDGATAYAIAETYKLEMMTVRARLMRWGKESPHEFPPPYGTKPLDECPLARSDGRRAKLQE